MIHKFLIEIEFIHMEKLNYKLINVIIKTAGVGTNSLT